MAITTRQQRVQRRNEALQLIADGVPPTDAASQLTAKWGCSRRTSLRDIELAQSELATACLLSSRSMVRIHQGASTTKPLQLKRLGMVQTDMEPPGVLRGIAPIRRSAVGLGNQGASLLI